MVDKRLSDIHVHQSLPDYHNNCICISFHHNINLRPCFILYWPLVRQRLWLSIILKLWWVYSNSDLPYEARFV